MANTKEIQKRMKSIQDTMKITSAMYMISSAKLRSAKQKLENTEPYFYALQSAISRLLRHIPDAKSRYFDQHEGRTVPLCRPRPTWAAQAGRSTR